MARYVMEEFIGVEPNKITSGKLVIVCCADTCMMQFMLFVYGNLI